VGGKDDRVKGRSLVGGLGLRGVIVARDGGVNKRTGDKAKDSGSPGKSYFFKKKMSQGSFLTNRGGRGGGLGRFCKETEAVKWGNTWGDELQVHRGI